MMKKIISCSLFLLLPIICFAQWSQLGNDITGMEGDQLGTNHTICLDASGQTLAIGSPFNSDNGTFSGFAKVYDRIGTTWTLRGNPINGTLPETEGTGAAVSLSADGLTLAVGSSHGINSLGYRCGVVSVYDWDGSSWLLRGAVIEGEGNASPLLMTDVFGSALSLSADGNFLVVGARGNTPEAGVLQIAGHARVYQWDGSQWAQMGSDIDGLTGLEEFGYAVSINDSGNIVAIGGRYHRTITQDSTIIQDAGYVRIFSWDGSEWEQRGDSFFGTQLAERLGSSIRLSADGNTVGMGAPNSGFETGPGYAKVFDWVGASWVQRGEVITGDDSAQAGSSIDLSSDGNTIAIGEPWHNSVYGQVRVFRWNNNSWEQVDNGIDDQSGPPNSINGFGSAVSLSSDGSIVAAGAFGFELGSFTNEGQVNVFQNQSLVSVDDAELAKISYYPNPTAHSLFVESSNRIERLEVFTIAGKWLNSVVVNDSRSVIDLSNLPPGAYFVRLESMGSVQTIRIIKK